MATISIKLISVLQDFIAPFYQFVKTSFVLNYDEIDDINLTNKIKISSSAEIKIAGFKQKAFNYSIYLENNQISSFQILSKKDKIEAICE